MSTRQPLVLDPCCGSRCFYFDKKDPRVLACDIRREHRAIYHERMLHVEPDLIQDFRHLPEDWTDRFPLVVFDPPHLLRAGERSYMRAKYGVLSRETWREDLRKGFEECFRVLAPLGTLIFKWNECQIPVSEILALTPHKPIFGNRLPSKNKTHWLVFFKQKDPEPGSEHSDEITARKYIERDPETLKSLGIFD